MRLVEPVEEMAVHGFGFDCFEFFVVTGGFYTGFELLVVELVGLFLVDV